MPELPEVETVRRGLMPVLSGQSIKHVHIQRYDLRVPVPRDFSGVVTGARIADDLIRRGKYIVIPLNNGQAVVLHLGMSGRCKVFGVDDIYTPEKHDHIVIETEAGARVVYNDARRFGMIYSVPLDKWDTFPPFDKMGMEPLGDEFTADVLLKTLHSKTKTSIKTALLDQRVVAGVGNIYACEALYESRIHPERVASALNKEEAGALVNAIKNVLNKAIAAGGSTLRDHKQTDGSQGYFQHQFDVYDRAGKSCKRCEDTDEKCITRIKQAGRSTFYCVQTQY